MTVDVNHILALLLGALAAAAAMLFAATSMETWLDSAPPPLEGQATPGPETEEPTPAETPAEQPDEASAPTLVSPS